MERLNSRYRSQNFTQAGKLKSLCFWTSLAAQWLRIRLPMQGTRVRALVQEDPTCLGTTKAVCHNY